MRKKIRTFKLLKKTLVFLPDDIIYKISKYCFNYIPFPKIPTKRLKFKLPREKRFIYIRY
jgi:hypothetical protein